MTVWIQPTEALAEKLDVSPVPLPVAESTAAALQAGTVDVANMAHDVDEFLAEADPTDPKIPVLRRCVASLALAAANGKTDDGDHASAADLLRLAVSNAPDDVGIRAAYGSALWMSGSQFSGLAQLTDAVRRNSEQGRIVPMLWVLTARAMADAGRHGDALLLLEDLAATEPVNFRFWELIDSIDARSTGVEGGYGPEHAEGIHQRLSAAVSAGSSDISDAWSAVTSLGIAEGEPFTPPPLCLEVTAASARIMVEAARPGSLGLLGSTAAVVLAADALPAPTPARSTVEIGFGSGEREVSALAAIGIDGTVDEATSAEVLQATALMVATFPAGTELAGDDFEHDLGPEASLALAAILDAIESAIRIGVPATGLPVSAVVEFASEPGGAGLRRSVRDIVGEVPTSLDVESGLGELVRLGFLELDGQRVNPIPYFGFLMSSVGNRLDWRRYTHHDTHARSLSRRHWLATAAGVLHLAPDGGGGVCWSVRARDEMQRELGVELAIIAG